MENYKQAVEQYMNSIAHRQGYKSFHYTTDDSCSIRFEVKVVPYPKLTFRVTSVHNDCDRGELGRGRGVFTYFMDRLEDVARKYGATVTVEGFANPWLARHMFKRRGYKAVSPSLGVVDENTLEEFYKINDVDKALGYLDTRMGYADASRNFCRS